MTFRDISKYCFGGFVHKKRDQFVDEQNSHKFRPSKKGDAPGGLPNTMYYFPSLSGTSFITPINNYYLLYNLIETIIVDYISPVKSQIISMTGNLLNCERGKFVSDKFFN